MTAVMAGIKVVEVAEFTFVPACAAVLSEWGADVVKIEHIERGDAMRGLYASGARPMRAPGKVHAFLEHSNRGKRSIALDLSKPEGLEILYRLVADADVFVTNKLPQVRARLKIDVDSIRHRNPGIIYVCGSGYGPKGPEAEIGGFDLAAFWSRSGVASGIQPREIDWMLTMPSPALGDSIAGMMLAGGVSAALLHRERTGEAVTVDVSLLAAGLWAMGPAIAISDQLEEPWLQPSRETERATTNAFTRGYRTADDRWITLGTLQAFRYWPSARVAFGLEHLADDPRFATHEAMHQHAAELAEILTEVIRARPLAHWLEALREFEGQWAVVADTLEVQDDPQVLANGYILEGTSEEGLPYKVVTPPVQFNGEAKPPRRAPTFNEHGDEILGDLGFDTEAIIDLKVKGVVA